MSLRRDIHSAFDEIAPSGPGLPERVIQTVITASSSRKNREGWMLRLRVPLSLVAAFVLTAMVVSVLIGSRLIQDWNVLHNLTPSDSARQAELALLEARPLNLPTTVRTLTACEAGPFNPANGSEYGTGPFYAAGGGSSVTSWGSYWHIGAFTDVSLKGLVLVRARDLITGQSAVFVGTYADGPVLGGDTLDGKAVQQHPYLVLDADRPPHALVNGGKLYSWTVVVGWPAGNSACVGWQVDGPSFTENFVSAP